MHHVHVVGGLNVGDGPVVLALTSAIVVLVAYLAITRRDVQTVQPAHHSADEIHPAVFDTLPRESFETNT